MKQILKYTEQSQLFAAASMATLTVGAIQGMGEKESSIPPENIGMMILYGWISQMLILIGIGLGRVAIVMFLLRIQGYQKLFKAVLLWFIAGSNLIINIVTVVLIIFQCSPVQKLWDDRISGSCAGREWTQKFGYFQGCECPFHVNPDSTLAASYLHLCYLQHGLVSLILLLQCTQYSYFGESKHFQLEPE